MSNNTNQPEAHQPRTKPALERSLPDLTEHHLHKIAFATQGLFLLAVLAVIYFTRSLLLPFIAALLLSFLFLPIMRFLGQLRLPAALNALLLVLTLATGGFFAIYGLSGPAQEWLDEAPYSLQELQWKLRALKEPVEEMQETAKKVENLSNMGNEDQDSKKVVVKESGLDKILFLQTKEAATGVVLTLILMFFMLAWGGVFFRNLMRAMPEEEIRRRALHITQDIERSISIYLFTITLINGALGTLVALLLHFLGMPNAILWGVIAAVLNYLPYLGPAITTVVLAFAALISYDYLGQALVVPGLFLLITGLEGQFLTPMIVGRRLTLNPLAIFVGVVFWFWMWGVPGALLTVPILVSLKITLDRIDSTHAIGRLLGR